MAREFTEAFALYILTCKKSYEELRASIERGDIPAGSEVEVSIMIPADVIDEIRFDVLAASVDNG